MQWPTSLTLAIWVRQCLKAVQKRSFRITDSLGLLVAGHLLFLCTIFHKIFFHCMEPQISALPFHSREMNPKLVPVEFISI